MRITWQGCDSWPALLTDLPFTPTLLHCGSYLSVSLTWDKVNTPEKQPTSGSYHRSFIKRHLHNGKEPKREAKGRDDLTKIALPSVHYAPEWQQLLLKARLELKSAAPHLLLPSKQPHLKLFTMPIRDINPLVLGGFPSTMGYSH